MCTCLKGVLRTWQNLSVLRSWFTGHGCAWPCKYIFMHLEQALLRDHRKYFQLSLFNYFLIPGKFHFHFLLGGERKIFHTSHSAEPL